MIRKIMLCITISTGFLIAQQPSVEIPAVLHQKIAALPLERSSIQISYKTGWPCIGVIGTDVKGKRTVYVALRYMGSGGTFQWTPFAAVPFDQSNDTFGMVHEGNKVVILQSNSGINHANTVGHYVELDRVTATVVLRPVLRIPIEQAEVSITFANQLESTTA